MPILVTYKLPQGSDPVKMGKKIAVGQTAGTWNARWEHRNESFQNHLATVHAIGSPTPDDHPTVTVAFPDIDFEGDLGHLLTLIFGKYSMAGALSVLDIQLPSDFGRRATVGLSGLRNRLHVHDRPFIMAIFKPAMGLSAKDHGQILEEVGLSGLDLIKDDEILGDLPSAPTIERLKYCNEALDRVESKTGRRPLYALNLTSAGKPLAERAQELVEAGAEAFLINGLAYGWHAVEMVRDAVDVPLFLHPAFAGAICGSPNHGLTYRTLLGTLPAFSGVDAVLYPAHYGSLPFDPREEAAIRDTLRSRNVAPVPSAGIHPGVVPRALEDYGVDVVLNAGTGIMDHPNGPSDGVRAFYEALDRIASKLPFTTGLTPGSPLDVALETWGAP